MQQQNVRDNTVSRSMSAQDAPTRFCQMPPPWIAETRQYVPRLEALPNLVAEASSVLSSLGVTGPMKDPNAPVRTILLIQLVLFCTGCLRVAYDLTKSAELLFREGRITSASLQLRLLLEYWGAVALASTLCDRVRDANNLEDAATLEELVNPISRLIGGSRIPVKLPRGGETSVKSFNVMNFIQHLEKCEPGAEQNYEFLCETCHPSYVQQSYLWMAGREGDNWTNDAFREHAHTLLERIVSAGESAAVGLARAIERVTAVSRGFVVASN